MPEKGVNAIYECIDFINNIKKYYNSVIKKENVCDFEIPYTTMNIGIIRGGETVNSVPGKCMITIDFRVVCKNDIDMIEKKVRSLLKKYNSKLIIRDKFEPKINNNNIEFLEMISAKKQTKCYLTEGSVIDKNFIILGPGPDTSHQKNEYVFYSTIKRTEELYEEIIKYYNE